MTEEEVTIGAAESPPPDWLERLRAKVRVQFGWWFKPWFKEYPEKAEEEEASNKLGLLYNEMIADINASEVSEDVKKGLDPLPIIITMLPGELGV
ncbi:unnamed protein product, partial [marine sediment metagenome]